MKKFIFVIAVFCFLLNTVSTQAQRVSKVTGGTIFAASGTTDFSSSEKPFNFGQNLLLNVCVITDKTYHNVVYGIANNAVKVVNGVPFGAHNLDVYFVPGYNLTSKVCSFATGIEKTISAGNVNFFLFSEVGKDLKSGSNITLCVGFHVNIQTLLYKRKG